jgi:hypothetical protein
MGFPSDVYDLAVIFSDYERRMPEADWVNRLADGTIAKKPPAERRLHMS